MAQLLERPLKVAEDHYLLKIQTDSTEPALPGQFINIRVSESTDPLVRRPFSIYNREKDILEIIIQVVGKGTSILCNAEPGPLDILGPLGKGFTLLEKGSALLVGGGVGNAPLYLLARELKEKGIDLDIKNMNEGSLDKIFESLQTMSIDIDEDDESVKIFCE